MKIIALFPIKNERWILDTTIPQLKLFADEILCLDGGSTDGTIETLRSYGVEVRDQDQTIVNYSHWRQTLLDWGRSRGGTHFVWLDSDEAFTTNFLTTFRDELAKMKPGQKLALQWLCLWKNPREYRDDSSIWSNLFKDFVFCDDGVSVFGDTQLHEGRTPGSNAPEFWIKLPKEQGAVLHYQFVPFQRFQTKQAFQRCRELTLGRGSARRINHRYEPTLDDKNAKTVTIPESWIHGIQKLDSIEDNPHDWYDQGILNFFNTKGIETFEPLQIWHIKKYRDMFIEKMKRAPRSKTYGKFIVGLNSIKNKLLGRA